MVGTALSTNRAPPIAPQLPKNGNLRQPPGSTKTAEEIKKASEQAAKDELLERNKPKAKPAASVPPAAAAAAKPKAAPKAWKGLAKAGALGALAGGLATYAMSDKYRDPLQ